MALIYDLTVDFGLVVWILLLGFMPVEHAVKHGHLPAIKYLLDHGADLHLQRGDSTLLHSAATRGTKKKEIAAVINIYSSTSVYRSVL